MTMAADFSETADEDAEDIELLRPQKVYLTSVLKYSADGRVGNDPADFIELREPTGRNRHECAKLKQMWTRAAREHADRVTPEQREAGLAALEKDAAAGKKSSGQDMLMGISSSTSVDLDEFLDVGCKLLTDGKVAYVDGRDNVRFNSTMLERLNTDDIEELVGTYIVGFIQQSRTRRPSGSS